MELVYVDTLDCSEFKKRNINGVYGDVLNLLDMHLDIRGIIYDDKWTVKRFLSSIYKHSNKRILSILKYLDLDNSILKKKICDLSTYNLKLVLLAYLLINNKRILIFDYFEVGLNYKEQKNIINILRKLKQDGLTIIYISNNLVFMNNIVDNIIVFNNDELVFNGNIIDLVKNNSNYIEIPPIIEFINLANKKDIKLEYTLDDKELLKDIYRSVSM